MIKLRFGRKSRRRLLIFLLILAPVLTFLLWPLTSDKYKITFDDAKIKYRQEYLKYKVERQDSTIRPNIIIILADDLSKMDVSSYGSPHIKTPNIDAIGEQGVRFQEAYITSPICAPSRAGLITGRYQQRYGFELNIHERYPKNRLEYYVYKNFFTTDQWQVASKDMAVPSSEDMLKQGLPPTEFTLAEIVKKYGYATAMIGKWHMGYNETAKPINRGFDYHYGFYEAFSLYAPVDDPNIINQKLTDFSDPHIWGKGRTGNCAIRRNDKVIDEKVYLTTQIAQESIDWIEDHKDEPFFMYIPFSAPHTPFQATKEYYDKYAHVKDPAKRVYYAMIHAMDDAIGDIMDKLKEEGLEENTIVFFLSDNGGATYTLAADNSPLKGGKFTNFEGGINVPFMMQWKGHLPEGKVFEHPVSALDIFQTSAEMTGCELPDDREWDGVNLIPYLTDSVSRAPHEALYWRSLYHKAIRKGKWKMIKDDKAKRTVLYDLEKDKYEKTNVAKDEATVVQDLEKDLAAWEAKMINPRWPRVMDFEIRDGEDRYYFPL